MKTYKIGFIKQELNENGMRFDKYVEIDMEADRINIDRNGNLELLDNSNSTIGLFSRDIWQKAIKKK